MLAASALALALGTLVMTGGPAVAHAPPTGTTVPAPAGRPAAMVGRVGPHEEGRERWSSLAVMVAVTGVVASGAAVAALAVWRRRGEGSPWPGPAQLVGGFALLFTGVAHCALAPAHYNEGWHLGLFFVASGLVLLGQAIVICLRPTRAVYRSVIASTALMIVLYFLGRQVTLPFVNHRDPYLLEDLPVKLAELLAAGLALAGLVKAKANLRALPAWTRT